MPNAPTSIEDKIAETLRIQRAEDAAGREAASIALPGPLGMAFAPQQAIRVGKYSVRPIYDLDFEFLQALQHPFAAFAVGRAEELDGFIPRGPAGWQLFWIFTNPIDDVDAAFSDPNRGPAWIAAEAKREFSRYQIGPLFAIYRAVVVQITNYAKTILDYAPDNGSSEGDQEASKRPPSGELLTGSVG
jgi:hypothetical protein